MYRWNSYEKASLKVSLWVGIVGAIISAGGVIIAVFLTLHGMSKDTDKKMKTQLSLILATTQREDTKRLILALDDKLLVPDMLGKTREEAFAKSEEAGLDTSGVNIESLPLSEVPQILASRGLTHISSSDTTVDFLNPITKDTIVIRVGTIFDQEPKAGKVVALKSKMPKIMLIKKY